MSLNRQELSRLIGSVYDAAADPNLWEPFLEELARTTDAESAALVIHDRAPEQHTLSASWMLDPVCSQLYQEYYGSVDAWGIRGRSKPPGYVCTSESLCPSRELASSEFYNDFLLPQEIAHGLFGLLENDPSRRCGSVSLYRGLSSGEFHVSDVEVLNFLIPHIQRAFKLHFQFAELKARTEGMEAALNMLTAGVVFLGTAGAVLLMNSRAEEVLNRRDGLLLTHGKLGAAVYRESTHLQAMIVSAARTGSGKGLGAGGTISISRKEGRPLSVMVAPLREFDPTLSKRPAAVLFISDPDRNIEVPVDLLRRCYGLTPAEARLAMILVEGKSVKEAADICGVKHSTAKSQLKSVFVKTNVRRQGELIRLLMNTAGDVRPRVEVTERRSK